MKPALDQGLPVASFIVSQLKVGSLLVRVNYAWWGLLSVSSFQGVGLYVTGRDFHGTAGISVLVCFGNFL